VGSRAFQADRCVRVEGVAVDGRRPLGGRTIEWQPSSPVLTPDQRLVGFTREVARGGHEAVVDEETAAFAVR